MCCALWQEVSKDRHLHVTQHILASAECLLSAEPLWDAGHAEARDVRARSLMSTSSGEAFAGSPQSAAGLAVQGRAAPHPDTRGALQAGAGQAPGPGPSDDRSDSEAGGQRAGLFGGGGWRIGGGGGGGWRGGGWRDNDGWAPSSSRLHVNQYKHQQSTTSCTGAQQQSLRSEPARSGGVATVTSEAATFATVSTTGEEGIGAVAPTACMHQCNAPVLVPTRCSQAVVYHVLFADRGVSASKVHAQGAAMAAASGTATIHMLDAPAEGPPAPPASTMTRMRAPASRRQTARAHLADPSCLDTTPRGLSVVTSLGQVLLTLPPQHVITTRPCTSLPTEPCTLYPCPRTSKRASPT